MPQMAGSIFLVLSLMAEAASVPTKDNILGEPEAPALREPRNPEEEDVADFGRPWVEDALGLANRGDGHGRSPASKSFGDGELRSLGLWPLPSFSSWPHGVPDEPVCQVKLERGDLQSPHLLQVVGLLNSYDSSFLKAVSSSSWGTGELEIFGMCPTDAPHGLLSSLRHVGDSLAVPEENHFLLLHLEEVKWEPAATKLRFELAIRTANAFGLFHLALLVFYRGEEISGAAGPGQKFLVGGEGLPQTQVVCLSRRTRYLVLQASATSGSQTPGRIGMTFSLEIKHLGSTGATLSPQDAQDLLFGFDAQCFTRRTPAVFLLAQRKPTGTAFPPSSFLAADGKVDMIPYLKASDLPGFGEAEAPSSSDALAPWMNLSAPLPSSTRHFLEALSEFVHKVLSPSGEPPLASRPHLQLDLGTVEGLPHEQLNLSEKVALEQLVRVEDHLVVLFPEDHQAWADHQVAQWSLRGRLLEQLVTKLRSVIRDLEAIPSFRANVDLFRVLLAFCYYPPGGPGDPSVVDASGAEGSRAGEKFHSLLLLKALQAVRVRWWESRRDTSRAHRRARHQDDYCRLREFEIDLISTGHIILPSSYNANNCAGPCRSPLSTRIPDHYHHTIFLLRMHEQGTPVTRPPCCIPVKYSKITMVTFTKDRGLVVKSYPNMVAESCGCR